MLVNEPSITEQQVCPRDRSVGVYDQASVQKMLLLRVGKPQLKHVPVVFLQPEATNKSFHEALHVGNSQ